MATDVEWFNVYFSTISVYISDFGYNFKLLKFMGNFSYTKKTKSDKSNI
jgi:hypothetical protein